MNPRGKPQPLPLRVLCFKGVPMAEATITLDSIDKNIRRMSEFFEKANTPNSKGSHDPRRVMMGWTGDKATNEYPEDRLKRLDCYDKAAVDIMCRKGGRTNERRLSGIGPYLCKMA